MSARITKSLKEAVEVLKNGGVVVFPTETCYGIGCDATNSEAVKRVKAIKKRSDDMPIRVIVKDMEMAEQYGEFSDTARMLAKRHWPGPLTVVMPPGKKKMSDDLAQDGSVGMRVSSDPLVSEIVAGIDAPLVATSANVHKSPSTYKVEDAVAQFEKSGMEPDLYFDGGELKFTPPSMVIEVIDGEVVVHRQGSFKL
ncbi:threonylcarbamoyl-AMP synthase [Candidatus Uhrbacteria bacterium]|jgi:L-threonylcarbamoyladenylate synthase|nr:threonylcarbamoyl-AMP synthase [Candidatus Uhrbacteria bacterium]